MMPWYCLTKKKLCIFICGWREWKTVSTWQIRTKSGYLIDFTCVAQLLLVFNVLCDNQIWPTFTSRLIESVFAFPWSIVDVVGSDPKHCCCFFQIIKPGSTSSFRRWLTGTKTQRYQSPSRQSILSNLSLNQHVLSESLTWTEPREWARWGSCQACSDSLLESLQHLLSVLEESEVKSLTNPENV